MSLSSQFASQDRSSFCCYLLLPWVLLYPPTLKSGGQPSYYFSWSQFLSAFTFVSCPAVNRDTIVSWDLDLWICVGVRTAPKLSSSMRWFQRLGIHSTPNRHTTHTFMVWAVTSSNEKSNRAGGDSAERETEIATLSSGPGLGTRGLCGPNGSGLDLDRSWPPLSFGGHQSRSESHNSHASDFQSAHWFVYAVFGVCFVRPAPPAPAALKPFPFAALPKWNANAIKMCLLSHLPWHGHSERP